MSRFRNTLTGVVVSVDDAKDHRFGDGWEPLAGKAETKPKPAASKSKK